MLRLAPKTLLMVITCLQVVVVVCLGGVAGAGGALQAAILTVTGLVLPILLYISISRDVLSGLGALGETARRNLRALNEQSAEGQAGKTDIEDASLALSRLQSLVEEKHRFEQQTAILKLAADEEKHKKEEQDRYYQEAHQVFMVSFSTALDKISNGVLDHRITDVYIKEYEDVRHAFNKTAEKLESAMQAVMQDAVEISAEAQRITDAAEQLSKHTEEQASALEETSASMEEMSATVRQNAMNAQEASAAAVAMKDLAMNGGRVVGEAVGAMDKIEQSSRRITEIVSLIEEIAFQTNILSLNAAVEAARAGEAGKGFAVVANEVRALSQRASSALKDVKVLIDGSNVNVQAGSELVKKTGGSLSEIVEAVKKVAALVSEIATSSHEQASGIEQVGRAVSNMDGMTQQNAGLVEETNLALQAARQKISSMMSAVSAFSIKAGRTMQPRAPQSHAPAPRNPVHKQQTMIEKQMAPRRAAPLRGPGAAVATKTEAEWLEF